MPVVEVEPVVLARWESRGGKHFAEVSSRAGCYGYNGNGCMGSLGMVVSDEVAISIIQTRVDAGYFLPDKAVLPMKRVI